jgi:hypothetical protein
MRKEHPFLTLRKHIRHAGRQFRHNNDNSKSIFHPASGFVYGYDVHEVEEALDEFEQTMPSEFQRVVNELTPAEELVRDANLMCATHPSEEVREFAASVLEHLSHTAGRSRSTNPLRLLDTGGTAPEFDRL